MLGWKPRHWVKAWVRKTGAEEADVPWQQPKLDFSLRDYKQWNEATL